MDFDDGGVDPRESTTDGVPRVPMMPRCDRVDLGPAGSLAQTRRRHAQLRRAALPPSTRDLRVWGSGLFAAAAVALLAIAIGGTPTPLAGLSLVGTAGVAA